MPRRRPPVDIYTTPVPDSLARAEAACPACGGHGQPYGFVVEKLVFRCQACGIRFKAPIGARAAGVLQRSDERP